LNIYYTFINSVITHFFHYRLPLSLIIYSQLMPFDIFAIIRRHFLSLSFVFSSITIFSFSYIFFIRY